MKTKIIFIALIVLCPMVFLASPTKTNQGVLQYLKGAWGLDQMYIDSNRVDSVHIQNVKFVLDTDSSKAYVLSDSTGMLYSLSVNTVPDLSFTLSTNLLYLGNPYPSFTYKVINVNESTMILQGLAPDSLNSSINHNLELRFIRLDSMYTY